MPGCPVYGGLAAYGGNRGRDGGRAGRPPCRCCFRARWARPGTSAAALAPACARSAFLGACLFPAARPVSSAALALWSQIWAVQSITKRRPRVPGAGSFCIPIFKGATIEYRTM